MNRNKRKRIFDKHGLTLIEVLVAVAVLGIAGGLFAVSYSNVLEDQRMDSDMTKLNNIDQTLEQILIYDDAFKDIAPHVYDDNKIMLTFKAEIDPVEGDSSVKLDLTTLNDDDTKLLKNECPVVYAYLTEYIENPIPLISGSYKTGEYDVTIEFSGAKVSDIRDYAIANDDIKITNSGDTKLKQHD